MDPKTASKMLREAADYIDAQLAAGKNPSKVHVARTLRPVLAGRGKGPLWNRTQKLMDQKYGENPTPEEAVKAYREQGDGKETNLWIFKHATEALEKVLNSFKKVESNPPLMARELDSSIRDAAEAVKKARDACDTTAEDIDEVLGAMDMWYNNVVD